MKVVASPLLCLSCGHEWTEETLADVLIEVFVTHIRLLKCPKCHAGANQLAFRRVTCVDFTPEGEPGDDRQGTDSD